MSKVTLGEGIFKTSQEIGEKYILSLDIDRFLAPCYEAHGLTPKKERYTGWESREISGHSLGHYMSALAAAFASSGNPKLKSILDYAVCELCNIQKTANSGYIGGLVSAPFAAAFSGDFTVRGFDLNGYWVPWYSVHKIYQGLIDAYKLTGNKQALDVVIKFADWAVDGLNKMSDEQVQRMLLCEHGGMNDVFAQLYALTENSEYLNTALRFTQNSILAPLENETDELQGLHANTQIPKIIGAAEIYNQDNTQTQYKTAAKFFWNTVVENRSYVFGGNSIGEHFEALGMESLGIKTAESCNSHNMLLLTKQLYAWEHSSRYADYYENVLLNHILGTQDPCTGHKTYFTSTLPGHYRIYSTKDSAWWCCTGTGMENPAKYNEFIYFTDGNTLYVNLFISSRIDWCEQGLVLEQKTSFPYENTSKITVTDGGGDAVIKLRVPSWIDGTMTVNCGGKAYLADKAGYIEIKRHWSKGDTIEITMPMSLSVYTAGDTKNKIAFRYGPVVLAGKFGNKDMPCDTITDETKLNPKSADVPGLKTDDANFKDKIVLKDKSELIFEIPAELTSDNSTVTLAPFFAIHHEYYNVYWFLNDTGDNSAAVVNKITVDSVEPDGQQDEIGHNMRCSEKCRNGSFVDEHGKMHMWREVHNEENGYFSYDLDIEKGQNYLCVEFWGSESSFADGIMYTRECNIYIDGTILANQKIDRNNIGKIYYVFYEIPQSLTSGKSAVTVTFKPANMTSSASIIGVRTTRSAVDNIN